MTDKKKYDRNSKNVYRDEKFKIKIYMIQTNQIEQNESDNENYQHFENLNYFDSDYEESDNSKNTVLTNNAISMNILCKNCRKIFTSNNQLHKHFRTDCRKINFDKNSVVSIAAFNFNSIINSKIDVNKDIDFDYDFKRYQYAFIEISLTKNEKSTSIYANTKVKIILIDTMYFTVNTKNVQIRTMTTSITVRDLNTNKHSTNKYAIVLMYFSKKDKNDTCVKMKITRKSHLIDNLKANMFIENVVLNSKMFDIFTSTLSTYIEKCEIIIYIFIKN